MWRLWVRVPYALHNQGRIPGNQSELPVVVVICARKDAIVLAGWNALLGQWIDWDTTDVLMRVRILHGVQVHFCAQIVEHST